VDCAPAWRTKVIRALLQRSTPARTAEIADALDVVTVTARRYLEDLSILKLATRSKDGKASNAPDCWAASEWLRDYFPAELKSTPHLTTTLKGSEETDGESPGTSTPGGISQFHADAPDEDQPSCCRDLTQPDDSDSIRAHDQEGEDDGILL
jgi:FaeA-like protein